MLLMDSAAPGQEPLPAEDDVAEREPVESTPPRPGTPIEVSFLKEPPVVLTDPPAIFGGASHTW
jgi:hypothetical protein